MYRSVLGSGHLRFVPNAGDTVVCTSRWGSSTYAGVEYD
jgi:hypothetical protein